MRRRRLNCNIKSSLTSRCANADGAGIFGILLSILCMWWVLIITKHPEMCCLDQFINATIFSVIVVIMAVLSLLGAFGMLGLMGFYPVFIIPGILYFWDLSILIPLAVFSIQSTCALKKGALTCNDSSLTHPHSPGTFVSRCREREARAR